MPAKFKCPVPGCGSSVSRISRHLTEVHKIASDTPQHQEARKLSMQIENGNDEAPSRIDSSPSTLCSIDLETLKQSYISHLRESIGDSVTSETILNVIFESLLSKSTCTHTGLCATAISTPDVLQLSFNDAMRKSKPGTVRAYKCVLKKFFNYIMAYFVHKYRELELCLRGRIAQLDSFDGVLKKMCRERTFTNFSEDRHLLLTVDEIQQLEESDYVLGYVRDLLVLERDTFVEFVGKQTEPDEDVQDQWPPITPPTLRSVSHATNARDVLITLLFFRSLQRTGAFIAMTVADVENATMENTSAGQVHVVSVRGHKTYSTHGEARFTAEPHLYAAMTNFKKHLRPLLLPIGDDGKKGNFFLTSQGGPLTSGVVSNGINKVGIAGNLTKSLKNITNLRKSMVTILYAKRPDLRALFAQQMAHRQSTGYNIINFFFYSKKKKH